MFQPLYVKINFDTGEHLTILEGRGGLDTFSRYVINGNCLIAAIYESETKTYISNNSISGNTQWTHEINNSINVQVKKIDPAGTMSSYTMNPPRAISFMIYSASMGQDSGPVIMNLGISTSLPLQGHEAVVVDRTLFENSITQKPNQPVFYFDLNDGHAEFWTGLRPGNVSYLGNEFDTSQTDFSFTTGDPYSPGGESDLAGGEGDFDNTSFPIDFPDLPTLSAVDTGLISLFNPYVSELKTLANFMWGQMFDLDNWKKLFANPMDALLGLSIVPVHVPNGGSDTVKVGNIDTGVSMTKAASQYVEVDCGTLNLNEYWGAYLDYEPYTHVQVYLPYIGTKEISTDDVMGKPVHIKYHVDILSGACVAYIKCGQSVMYSFNGQCSASIPITGRDWTNVVNGVISLVSSTMGMIAMGQAAGALGSAAGLAKSATSQARLAAGAAQMQSGMIQGGSNIAATAIDITKPIIQKSGAVSSTSGLLGVQTPYMILTRPRQCLPSNQNKYIGYPSLVTRTLGDCEGFTRVEAIHLENIGATDAEIEEIESILHSGVIF